ncbi:hypothetical protein OF83DRAFT_1058391 [Amylostereum chailletii]|nr:hypothetical protein OF83DRAFT_1058391 [Amylostereum chailletii]
MSVAQLTLYTARVCPFAQRVELALAEAGAKVTKYQIDLANKPEWYAPQVNPASKVPAVAYGGPDVLPDQPSPDSAKIAESLVLLEFVADLFPKSDLLPTDPVARARVRFFIDAVATKFAPAYVGFTVLGTQSADKLYDGLEDIQKLLPPVGFAAGPRFSNADAALAPFLGRLELFLRNDVGKFAVGEGKKAHETIFGTPRFERLQRYFEDVTSRESWKSTFEAVRFSSWLRVAGGADGSVV